MKATPSRRQCWTGNESFARFLCRACLLYTSLAGGLSLVSGRITAGDMVAYMLYVTTLIATIRRIVEFAEQFAIFAFHSARRLLTSCA